MLASVKNIIKFKQKFYNYVTKAEKVYPRKIFSGIQPTGNVHIGNYLGVIQKLVQLQDCKEDITLSIADMHSITLPHEPKELSNNILKTAAILLACGINPKHTMLFQQSTVPMHAELSWVLGCITTMARLQHLPQFKEKSENLKNIPLGLYIYPVLQAADILLYRATHVPVGQDQAQHIQLATDLATSFNKKFGETFPVPHRLNNDNGIYRIKSLRNPAKKMSKSEADSKSRIELIDEPDVLCNKIKKAVTDCTSAVAYDPENRAGVSNLISIHSLITGKSIDEICYEARGIDTGMYKFTVADAVIEKLTPIRMEFSKLIKEPAYLESILKEGTQKAIQVALPCWHDVRQNIGFGNDFKFSGQIQIQSKAY